MVAIAEELTAGLVIDLVGDSVTDALRIMINCSATKTKTVAHASNDGFYPVTAVIGLAGDVAGSICVSMSRQSAAALLKQILDVDIDSNSALVRDGVCELANIIVGSAKNGLDAYSLRLGLPTTILGDDVSIMFPSQSVPVCMEFESEIGPFKVVVGLQRR